MEPERRPAHRLVFAWSPLRFVFFFQNRRDQGLTLSRPHTAKKSVNSCGVQNNNAKLIKFPFFDQNLSPVRACNFSRVFHILYCITFYELKAVDMCRKYLKNSKFYVARNTNNFRTKFSPLS